MKEPYVDVQFNVMLDGWNPFVSFVITSTYNFLIEHALKFWKTNIKGAMLQHLISFLFYFLIKS
jgi:hypothetical protein